MNRLLLLFCVTIALLSAELKWYLDLGIRFNFFELMMLIFILIYFIIMLSRHRIRLPHKLRTFILFQYGLLIFSIGSGCVLIFYPQSQDSILFYVKGVLQLFIYTFFFTCLLAYLSELNIDKREYILKSYIWGVAISSIYGIGQIVSIIYYGVDLDVYIHSVVPFFQKIAADFESQGYGGFYRLSGLPGDPNVHASYAMTALPLMCYYAFQKREWIYSMLCMLVILSIVLSISVSGSVACITSLTIYFILFRKKNISSNLLTLIVASIPIIIILYTFEEHVYRFLSVKLDPSGTGLDRYNIALQSIEIVMQYPMGIGFNNFSLAYEKMYSIVSYNPHNSWLATLVELGIVGLIYQLIFTAYIFIYALKINNDMAKVLVSTYAGICVASLGYSSLSLFYTQFIINILFAVFVLNQSTQIYRHANSRVLQARFPIATPLKNHSGMIQKNAI